MGLGMAPQPRPEGPAWRTCRDVAAADLAGHLDPQDDGHFGTPMRPDLDVAAFGRYFIGVDHNAGLCHQRQPACVHIGVDQQRWLHDHRLGEIQRHAAAGDPHFHTLRHEPAAITLHAAAMAVDAGQVLRLGDRRARGGIWSWPAGPWSAPQARRGCVPSRLPPAARRVLPRSAGHHRPPPAAARRPGPDPRVTPAGQPERPAHHRAAAATPRPSWTYCKAASAGTISARR